MSEAQAALAKISTATGTYGKPPTGGPKATPGKSVFVVSASNAIPYFAAEITAIEKAADELGWNITVFDGKYQPNEWLAGVRQAVTANADGIITAGIDCAPVKAGLQEAKAANIPVVAIYGFDCNDQDKSAEPLFSAAVTYVEGSLYDYAKAAGAYQADWAIAHTEGTAKVLEFVETDALTFTALNEGFDEALKTCTGCSVVGTVEITGADYGPTLQQKAQQALVAHPDATIVYPAGAEAALDAGIAAAIRSAPSKPIATSNTGGANAADYISSGVAGMTLNLSPTWEGWAGVDDLVKLFGGATPAKETGLGLRLIDEEHNLDSFTPYTAPVDFESSYLRSWGVE